jgi:Protein of unknown function (DUF2510)
MPGIGRDGISSLPPAGWYQDPTCPGVVRYWDGHAWSLDQVRTTPAADAVVSPASPNLDRLLPGSARRGGGVNEPSAIPEGAPSLRPARSRRRWGWGIAVVAAILGAGAAGVVTVLTLWPGTASSPAEQYAALADRSNAAQVPLQRDLNAAIAPPANPAQYRRALKAWAVYYRSFDRELTGLHLPGRAGGDAVVLVAAQEMIARGLDQIAAAPNCGCTVAAEIGPFQSIKVSASARLRSDLGLPPVPITAPALKAN